MKHSHNLCLSREKIHRPRRKTHQQLKHARYYLCKLIVDTIALIENSAAMSWSAIPSCDAIVLLFYSHCPNTQRQDCLGSNYLLWWLEMNVILLVNGNFFSCRQLFKKHFSDRICWYTLFNVGSSFTLYRVFSQEADGALILPPLPSVLRFKGIWSYLGYTERKEVETKIWDPGIELATSCTKAAH